MSKPTITAKATKVYGNYRANDLIKGAFRSGKSGIEMNAVRAHSDLTLEG